MKMFILGVVSFYIVSSLIGFVLNQLEILDNWSFGEFYTELIPLIVIIPFTCIKNIHNHWDYYKLMIKLGYLHKKYEELRNLDTPTLRDIQNTKCGFAVRSYIDTILKERNQTTYTQYKER